MLDSPRPRLLHRRAAAPLSPPISLLGVANAEAVSGTSVELSAGDSVAVEDSGVNDELYSDAVWAEKDDWSDAGVKARLPATRPSLPTDQGSQFTCREFIRVLEDSRVRIRMDGKRRYSDIIFVEWLRWTVKHEEVCQITYGDATEARRGLGEYFRLYNNRRPHQPLGYRTPAEGFYGEPAVEELKKRKCSDQLVLLSSEGVHESHLIVV